MMDDKRFNKIFNAFILIGMTVAIVITTMIKSQSSDGMNTILYVSAIGSLMGILSTVCSANGKILTFLFGTVDVAIYAVICFISAKYGNAFLHALYFLPMQFVGLWQWRRRRSEGSSSLKARRLTPSKRWIYSGIFLAGTAILYLVLAHFDSEAAGTFIKWAILADAFATICNLLGQYLLSAAYMEQWIFWIGVNVSTVIMWSIALASGDNTSYTLVYIIKYVFYFLNSLNGLRIWLKLSRPADNEPDTLK